MSDYAILSQLLPYLPAVSDDADKATLEEMITRASRTSDSQTRRHSDAFAPASNTPSAQVFYGAGSPVLLTSEFVEGSVTTVTAPTGYAPEGWTEFRRREAATGSLRVGLHTATPEGIRTPRVVWRSGVPFTITAKWGFVSTPAEITEATLKLVRAWWRAGQGEVSGTQGELQAARAPERGIPREVLDLVAPYVLEDVVEEESEGGIERGELIDGDHNAWRDPFTGGGPTRF